MKNRLKKIIICIVITCCICIFLVFRYRFESKSIIKNANSEWKITQFGDNEGPQMMCFTIEGNKNGLVIIDGGYKENEEQYNFLIKKITKHNNVVDAWIITHFDSDHGGEFIRIAKSEDISIKKIYVTDAPTDMNVLKENAPDEDDWSVYEEYLTMNLPQKIIVHPNDKFKLINLNLEVLCSYEDWIDEKTDNLLNNGAMVFKIYGNKESFLFCGDVQSEEISKYLIKKCKGKLKSDYLQVPHHGNNYMGDEFYKLVKPKIAFFSAPDWLINNERNISWFTVKENRAILEKLGSKIIWYNTSPNELIFK